MTTTRRILFLAFFLISGVALTVSRASLAVRTGTQPPPAHAGGTDTVSRASLAILSGSPNPPADAGGTDSRAISRRAPSINGRLEGSIQQLTPENVTLNGGATITEKLYVPGTPTVRRNGNPNFGGVIEGSGSAIPTNYQVTLNGNATLGNLVNRTNPFTLTPVAAPPTPTGTRDVSLNTPNDQIGDFATLRNLTLNGNAGTRSVPPGTYGNFTVNGSSVLIFGVANTTESTSYNLQGLTLNGGTQLQIVGPVTLTLRNGTNINGSIGNAANPQWLTLNVSNGGVTLNGGSQIFGKVNAPAGSVTVNSRLTGNVICDRLTVNGGGVVTILAQAPQDTTAPVITIAEPAQGLITKISPVTVSGTVTDTSAVTVTINGQPVTLSGTQFSTTVTLAEGSNTITVLATDAFGNVGTASRNVTLDTTAPVLTVTSPQDGAVTTETQLTITGTVTDATATTVTVNNVAATRNGNEFSALVSLVEGPNTFVIRAEDAAGNQTETTQTVTLQVQQDTTPPVITLTEPAEGLITNVSPVTVSGTVTDASAVTVTVNNQPATLSGTEFTASMVLAEGSNTITVLATDAFGNVTMDTRIVTIDTVLPVLVVNSPQNGKVTDELKVVGTVTDTTQVTLLINRNILDVNGDGTFEGTFVFEEDGAQELQVKAVDAGGNESLVTRTVIIDRTNPDLSNLTPVSGTLINTPTTSIQGVIRDTTQVTVTVNDSTVEIPPSSDPSGTPFIIPNITITEGENRIELMAVDEVGNNTRSVLFLNGKDRTPPLAPVVFPVSSLTRLSFQTIEGRAEAGTQIIITGGVDPITVEAAFGSGLFIANVNLQSSLNSLSVTATDLTGNVSPPAIVSIISNPNLPLPSPGQPGLITVATGNAQRGLSNTELPRPLVAFVTDSTGNPVANVAVNFSLKYGNGKFVDGNETVVALTNEQGYAVARYVVGDNGGVQLIQANFTDNTASPAEFIAEVLLPAENGLTTVSGLVLDQNMRALPNAVIRIGGQNTRTGLDGRFVISQVTAGPHQLLEVIGRDEVTLPGRWPVISHDIDVLPGVDNNLGRPIFLPRVNEGINLPLDSANTVIQDTTYELPVVGGESPIRVTAKAGTRITFPPDISDKRFSATRIPVSRVPMGLEDGRYTSLYVSVQPSGTLFDPPLEISFPNLDRLAANSKVLLMSFDHDAGRYVQVGTGHVSPDGKTVSSDPGSGIIVGAWHGFPPEPPCPQARIQGKIQIKGTELEQEAILTAKGWVEAVQATRLTDAAALATAERWDYVSTIPACSCSGTSGSRFLPKAPLGCNIKTMEFDVQTVSSKVTIDEIKRAPGDPQFPDEYSQLPSSMPPYTTTEVNVTFDDPDFIKQGVQFKVVADLNGKEVEGGAIDTGKATIQGNDTLNGSGKIVVKSTEFTFKGFGQRLKIKAYLVGAEKPTPIGESKGFTICPHPTKYKSVRDTEGKGPASFEKHPVQNNKGDVDDKFFYPSVNRNIRVVGIVVKDTWETDSGDMAPEDSKLMRALLNVEVKELVVKGPSDQEAFHPLEMGVSGFRSGHIANFDRHFITTDSFKYAKIDGERTEEVHQMSVFTCALCGAQETAMPFSGFVRKNHLTYHRSSNKWFHKTTKSPWMGEIMNHKTNKGDVGSGATSETHDVTNKAK